MRMSFRWDGIVATAILASSVAVVAIGCAGKEDGFGAPPVTEPVTEDAGVPEDSGSAFPDTGIGTSGLSIARVVPDHGPFIGGNQVILRGSGFTEDAVVTFDGLMVQPADMELIDSRRLSVVAPAGEVGPADVAIQVGDDEFTLAEGYTYDRIYVDPSRGSVSGGTLVSIVGKGTSFAAGDEVTFGGTACRDVEIVSETRIECRTPPMAADTVDVNVTRGADGSETIAPDAFTYYDGTDPFGGGLGGGPISGSINVTVINAGNGAPVPDAFAMVGNDLATDHQGLTDLRGQITFSGEDLVGDQTIHVAKHCFEKTSVVSFDASDVTVFLVPWMDPMCGMGGAPGGGRGRNGTFLSGELIWEGPNEYGPNPWANIPDPRGDEVKVAYVYTTRRSVDFGNPDPSAGGSDHRVLEVVPDDGEDHLGYPYRIFARPAGLAVYALAGLENPGTGEFIPYVMGVARNVLGGPGEEVEDVDILMNIPLDHVVDVRLRGLPEEARTGPDRFRVDAYMDLGGEGVIARGMWAGGRFEPMWDVVRARTTERPFRFWGQPALFGNLSDGRYRIEAGWYTGDFDAPPYTVAVRTGVREVDEEVVIDSFLGIPQATSPAFGEGIPEDRTLRWESDGPAPDLHIVLMTGGDGNPAWRHLVPGDVTEAPVPDLSTIPEISDISPGFLRWQVFAVNIPGFDFNELSYSYLSERFWTEYALDSFTATR